jgi:hypothetical protein
MAKIKDIILAKKRTRVEISPLDGWIFEVKYLVNVKETYYCQILKTDLPGRIERLKKQGFK